LRSRDPHFRRAQRDFPGRSARRFFPEMPHRALAASLRGPPLMLLFFFLAGQQALLCFPGEGPSLPVINANSPFMLCFSCTIHRLYALLLPTSPLLSLAPSGACMTLSRPVFFSTEVHSPSPSFSSFFPGLRALSVLSVTPPRCAQFRPPLSLALPMWTPARNCLLLFPGDRSKCQRTLFYCLNIAFAR